MREKYLRGNLYIGLFVFIMASLLLALHNPFMQTWYYIFAWWSFILAIDSLNYRIYGRSPFAKGFFHILFMGFISVCVWLLFELFNLRLNNWAYFNLPASLLPRWLGYFLAFATVIPALNELSLLFSSLLKRRSVKFIRIRPSRTLLAGSIVFGIVCLAATLLLPDLFFPLVWLGVYFLIEPLNYIMKTKTLLADMENRDWGNFLTWILSGFTAGILWEFWNFWAGSHWEYSLPYLDFWRIFHMPVFGFLGFLPFALEVFALWNLAVALNKRIKRSALWAAVIVFILLVFCVACFYLMDAYTVIS